MRAFSTLHIDAAPLTADVTPEHISTAMLIAVAIYLEWTGVNTPTGNFKVQVSLDEPGKTPVNWVDLDTTTFQVAAGGSAGSKVWRISDIDFNFLRVVYDRTSGGSGDTVICRVSGKGW